MSDPATNSNTSETSEASKPKLEAVPTGFAVTPTLPPVQNKNQFWSLGIKLVFICLSAIAIFEFGKSTLNDFLYFEITDDAQLSSHFVYLNAKLGGIVSKVNVSDNAQVKKGQVLVLLDDREYINSLKQVEADLNYISAKYWYANSEYKRGIFLYKKNVITKARYELLKSENSAILAEVWSKKAQLDQAKLNLEFTQIKAPSDGWLGKIQVEPGLVIRPNQNITSFVDNRDRWVVANFKETQLKNIRIGQRAEIEIDAIENRVFYGKVESISPGSGSSFSLIPPDNATGNFTKIVQRIPIKISFELNSIQGYETRLIPGISVLAKIRLSADKGVTK